MSKGSGSLGDEIELKELCCLLWQQRWLVGTVFLLVTACAVAYALLAKPVYEAEFRILPPTRAQLSAYHALAGQMDLLMPDDARQADSNPLPDDKSLYDRFVENVQSNVVQSDFLSQVFIPALSGQAGRADARWQRVLDGALTITLPKSNETAMTLAFSGGDPRQLIGWLNSYLDTAQSLTRRQIQSALLARQRFILGVVQEHIQTLRSRAKAGRLADIVQVQNALAVAKEIGLQDASPQTQWSDNMARGGDLMYLRGARALAATLAELKSRTSDDAYISELPSLLEKERQLQQLDLAPKLDFAYIDRPAFPPSQPVKPRRALIVAFGGMLGLVLGMLVVFLRRTLK